MRPIASETSHPWARQSPKKWMFNGDEQNSILVWMKYLETVAPLPTSSNIFQHLPTPSRGQSLRSLQRSLNRLHLLFQLKLFRVLPGGACGGMLGSFCWEFDHVKTIWVWQKIGYPMVALNITESRMISVRMFLLSNWFKIEHLGGMPDSQARPVSFFTAPKSLCWITSLCYPMAGSTVKGDFFFSFWTSRLFKP